MSNKFKNYGIDLEKEELEQEESDYVFGSDNEHVGAVGDGEGISEHITEGCTVYVRDEAPSVEISEGVYLVMHDAIYGVLW